MENKRLKIGGGITLSIIFLLFILQINVLYEVYCHEKNIFQDAIQISVLTHIDKLNDNKRNYTPLPRASFNSNKKYVRIIRCDIDTTIYLQHTINPTFILCQLMYDIRDTSKWNLDTLHRILNPHLQERHFLVPYQLTLIDSAGHILDQYSYKTIEDSDKSIKFDIALGFLEQHTLKAEFSFPFLLFLQHAWDRIITTLALILVLLLCATSLYLQLKHEKQRSAKQEKFTHALVHNLRSPLITLKRQLEIIQIQLSDKLDSEQTAYLNHGKKNTVHVLEDIEQLLSLSVNAYHLVIHPEYCRMSEILEQLVADYQYCQPNKEISMAIHNQLPDDSIYADPLHLYGALGNLIGNAIKYSDKKVSIYLLCRKEHHKVFISVKDDGFGIPPEEQKLVFREHHRGKRYESDRDRKGYGLGLSYVQAVIVAHRGHICIISDGQQGTEFVLEIPQPKKR